jgi:hypothetical protein
LPKKKQGRIYWENIPLASKIKAICLSLCILIIKTVLTDLFFLTERSTKMAIDKEGMSTAESLRKTRTYGKFRCHNPTCMERLEPKKGDKTVKCPTCGMEFRVAWVKDGFPRCRGPVWEVNKKIAEEALAKKLGDKTKEDK